MRTRTSRHTRMAELHGWNIIDGCLTGSVYGHERFPDGTRVRTSRIRMLQGDWAQTENGSVYRLCKRAAGKFCAPANKRITAIADAPFAPLTNPFATKARKAR